jgi:hypothetical protein
MAGPARHLPAGAQKAIAYRGIKLLNKWASFSVLLVGLSQASKTVKSTSEQGRKGADDAAVHDFVPDKLF